MTKNLTLIIGANSEIAKGLATKLCNEGQLVVISRDISFYQQLMFDKTVIICVKDYSESSIITAVKTLHNTVADCVIRHVYICHGVLHNSNCFPERRIEEFSPDAFIEVVNANTATPMLWLKHLIPLLKSKLSCKLVFFSARVGSIGDNHLGGWYSYRASKTALNMLLKSAAIELARRSKNVKLISFHPGTTKSPLSKPFFQKLSVNKLLTPQFVAKQLIDIIEKTEIDGELSYVDWQGKNIDW